jgi:hypothetical protein
VTKLKIEKYLSCIYRDMSSAAAGFKGHKKSTLEKNQEPAKTIPDGCDPTLSQLRMGMDPGRPARARRFLPRLQRRHARVFELRQL